MYSNRHLYRSIASAPTTAATITNGIKQQQSYDIAIIGASTVGLALAASVRDKLDGKYKIGLFSGHDLFANQGVGGNEFVRYVSLTGSSRKWLEKYIPENTVLGNLYDNITVYDDSSPTTAPPQSLTFSDVDACISTPSLIESSLLKYLSSHQYPTEVFNNTKISSIQFPTTGDTWPQIDIGEGRTVRARLIVGADGRNSMVKKAAGIESIGADYGRSGVVGTFGGSGFENRAWQRFLADGPLAILPLSPTSCTIVWTLTPTHAKNVLSLPPSHIPSLLNAALVCTPDDLEYLLAHTSSPTFLDECTFSITRAKNPLAGLPLIMHAMDSDKTMASFPLIIAHAKAYTRTRVALVGDAAHSIHPLAGQGLNLGLSDVAALSQIISDSAGVGDDFGLDYVLGEYSRKRYIRNMAMIGAVHGIESIYGGRLRHSEVLSNLRRRVIRGLEGFEPAKRVIQGIVG